MNETFSEADPYRDPSEPPAEQAPSALAGPPPSAPSGEVSSDAGRRTAAKRLLLRRFRGSRAERRTSPTITTGRGSTRTTATIRAAAAVADAATDADDSGRDRVAQRAASSIR